MSRAPQTGKPLEAAKAALDALRCFPPHPQPSPSLAGAGDEPGRRRKRSLGTTKAPESRAGTGLGHHPDFSKAHPVALNCLGRDTLPLSN